MRISSRLNLISAGTGVALVLLAVLLAGAFSAFREAKDNDALAVAIRLNFIERTTYRDQYLLYREERNRALWFQNNQVGRELLEKARRQFKPERDRETLERMAVNMEESAALFSRIVSNSHTVDLQGGASLNAELDRRLVSQLQLRAAAIRDAATELQDECAARAERAYLSLAGFTGLFAATLALVTILTSVQIARLLRRRLVPLHEGVQRVAQGDLAYRLEAAGADEFSELAVAFNSMTEQLQGFTQRLEAEINERKLSQILEGVDAYIYLKDLQGRYLFANRLVCELLEQPLGAILGQAEEPHLDPATRALLREREAQVLQLGVAVRGEETLVNLHSGRTTTLWTVRHPIRDEHGEIYALCGVSTDLTELKQMEARLTQAQKMQSLGNLAGGVAHDMNNVLGAILSLATAHLTLQAEGSPVQQAFATIARAATRGGELVKSLLGFARQTPAENLPLDLNELILEEMRLLERTTLARVRLRMDLAPDLKRIRGDAGALSHVIMNLCVNAVDAMGDNGDLLLRSCNLGDDQVEVAVVDSGSGMVKAVLDKAMDPFFTTKEQGKGTGLGLSLAYSTIVAHQGQMLIQSQPGQGTTVLLRFPAVSAGLLTEAAPAAPAPPRSLAVFLVDDDELIQSSIGVLLGIMGHQATLASTGEEALALLAEGYRPDVVILDMNMPGLGGAGTLPLLRAGHPGLPVLLATGRADQTALDLVRDFPGVTLMSKPFTMEELSAHLQGLPAAAPGAHS